MMVRNVELLQAVGLVSDVIRDSGAIVMKLEVRPMGADSVEVVFMVVVPASSVFLHNVVLGDVEWMTW
jgi:hypothetical protein